MSRDEEIARALAEQARRLAPKFVGLKGRLAPRWDDLPFEYRALLLATVRTLLDDDVIR